MFIIHSSPIVIVFNMTLSIFWSNPSMALPFLLDKVKIVQHGCQGSAWFILANFPGLILNLSLVEVYISAVLLFPIKTSQICHPFSSPSLFLFFSFSLFQTSVSMLSTSPFTFLIVWDLCWHVISYKPTLLDLLYLGLIPLLCALIILSTHFHYCIWHTLSCLSCSQG